MLAGSKFGGGEVSTSQGLCIGSFEACGWVFFWEKSLSPWLTLTQCRIWVAPFLPGGRYGYLMSTSLCVPGETLWPYSPGSSVSLFFLKVLLSTWWFGAWSGWHIFWGRSGCGSLSFSRSAFVSILFVLLGMFLLLPQHFFNFKTLWLHRVVAILI
jgi:hypothetical protein